MSDYIFKVTSGHCAIQLAAVWALCYLFKGFYILELRFIYESLDLITFWWPWLHFQGHQQTLHNLACQLLELFAICAPDGRLCFHVAIKKCQIHLGTVTSVIICILHCLNDLDILFILLYNIFFTSLCLFYVIYLYVYVHMSTYRTLFNFDKNCDIFYIHSIDILMYLIWFSRFICMFWYVSGIYILTLF